MTVSLGTAVGLLLGGLFVLVLELFIPSAGILFLVSTACILASVFVAFLVSAKTGLVFLILVLFLGMLLPIIGLNLWKKTPIARKMMLRAPTDVGEANSTGPSGSESFPESLLGKVVRSATPLRPSGVIEFEGRRFDAMTEGLLVEAGVDVKVVSVRGNLVVVRQLSAMPKADEPSGLSDFEFDSSILTPANRKEES